ncbi:MAG: ABC transporter ATP-binding protein [Phycisphaerae bacterium]
MSAPLEITHVSKCYRKPGGRVQALDGVSLGVRQGELVVLRGPSGSGKTTLLLAAGGLLAPDTGEVRIDGRNPYALPPEERARLRAATIGFVFQQYHLIPYLNVLENVMTPALAVHANQARSRAAELLECFQLADRANHVPAELSTGERQRTALARALLNRPGLLLADEPTGNLDPENAAIVLEHIAEFARAGGAVLAVTHDEVVRPHADRIVQLRKGRIIPAGEGE